MSKRNQRTNNWQGEVEDASTALSLEALTRMGYGLPDERQTTPVLEGAIVPQEDGTLVVDGFTLTSVGLEIPKETSFDHWQNLGRSLLRVGSAAQWCLGDWLAYGDERHWGETYQQMAREFGYEIETLYTYAWLCRKVQISIRNRDLSPSHHRLIARFDPDLQRQWLDWAATVNDGKPAKISQMRQAIRAWEITNSPTPSDATTQPGQKTLISREKPREMRQFLKIMSKAGQGDKKAKQRALGWISEHRKWLDDVEEWLKK